ncbi:MAG: NAD(P)H-dependent oxidoreductase subunit E [Planctomycetaceae bacterium]
METWQANNSESDRYRELQQFIDASRQVAGPLIQVLHRAQRIFGYLPEEVQRYVAQELRLPLSKVHGVVTFYNFFRTEPMGDHLINVCLGTACHVKGASEIIKSLEKSLAVKMGGTTADRFFTLSLARCFGACGLAPCMMIDNEVYGRLNPTKATQIVQEIKSSIPTA